VIFQQPIYAYDQFKTLSDLKLVVVFEN